ncbi:MAG: AraC family transcriptional regulator [Prevotellaceae bacterium]|nr:AraC family transcriptional regulator [Prevotellaceae bacterium]
MANSNYLLTHASDHQWGITTKTVGIQDVKPGNRYPIGEHPEDYLFFPDKGRILQETQILYIIKGSGWFVSAHQPRTQLRAGDSVILYPHEWHNYAPDPQTGWAEAWIGFTGKFANMLVNKYFPDKSHPIHHVGVSQTLCAAYEKACEIAVAQMPAYQQQLAGYIGLIVSTIYARSQQLPFIDNPDTLNIKFATRLMRKNLHRNMHMEDIATEVGMSYSKFRKQFKNHTGFPPAQYFLRLKMERAKDYLLNTTLSCKEISFRLGFDSASYFNKMFRYYQGQTPRDFRTSGGTV